MITFPSHHSALLQLFKLFLGGSESLCESAQPCTTGHTFWRRHYSVRVLVRYHSWTISFRVRVVELSSLFIIVVGPVGKPFVNCKKVKKRPRIPAEENTRAATPQDTTNFMFCPGYHNRLPMSHDFYFYHFMVVTLILSGNLGQRFRIGRLRVGRRIGWIQS
jgi:hypothetical protein